MEYLKLNKDLIKQAENAVKIASDFMLKSQFFSPFIIYGKESNKLERLITDSIDKALDAGVEFIEEIDDNSEIVIFCYNEKIKLNDGNLDAIVTQIYGVDEETAYSFAHGYKIIDKQIVFLNKIIFLGNIRNCLVY